MNFNLGKLENVTTTIDGSMDEIRVYNRALSASEVAELYRLGASFAKPPNNLGLIGYWSFNEGTSTVSTDFSGNGNHGTLNTFANPPTATSGWTAGTRQGALMFDGIDDYVSAPLNLSSTQTVSLAFWARKNPMASDKSDIEFTDMDSGTGGFSISLSDPFGSCPGSTTVYVRGNVGYNGACYTTPSAGVWHHYVGVYDKSLSSNEVDFYVDGSLQTPTSRPDNSNNGNTFANNTIYIGAGIISGNPTGFENEILDEVRVYNRALTAPEVAALYGSGAAQMRTSAELTTGSTLGQGLIGLWTLDGSDMNWTSMTAGTVFDRSGNNNTATINGMEAQSVRVPGKLGQALQFDGINDELTTTTQFTDPSPFSVSVWFKTTTVSGGKIIGFETNQTGTGCNDYDRHMYVGTDGDLYFGWWSGAAQEVSSLSTVNDGNWHHAVGTHTGSIGTLYVDGVQQGTNASAPQDFTGYWRIGGYCIAGGWPNNGGDGYFSGTIDDARIYNRVLSATEVKQLYNLGKATVTP
jgi:hypothetical protein